MAADARPLVVVENFDSYKLVSDLTLFKLVDNSTKSCNWFDCEL